MKPITAIVLGAGSRGTSYANYALAKPEQLQIVAVAEPREDRRNAFGDTFHIPQEHRYSTWKEVLDKPKMADVVFVCTMDKDHLGPALAALDKGYHILQEKPMSNREDECIAMEAAAAKAGKHMAVCHVLRYTPFYQTIKNLIDSGEIGEVTVATQIENVAYWHQAHSFVRGNWRNSVESSPMILQKCCHDVDILLWLTGKSCKRVSSFGSLRHFRKENAPEGALERCLDGCPHKDSCLYYAPKLYLTGETGWPVDVLTTDLTPAGIEKALREGPYGRCVYHCDNDVVDRQVVNMELEDGVICNLVMSAFTATCCRQLKILGTTGQIQADMSANEIWLHPFGGEPRKVEVPAADSGHGGGDFGLMRDFLQVVREGGESRSSAKASLQSHLICFAAEKSRLEGRIVQL